jgi:hypothetical protein
MADVLALPDERRQVMVWLLRQGTVTLPEIAQHLERSEEEAQMLINPLIEQGFIQIIVSEPEAGTPGESRIVYRAQSIQRQRSPESETGNLPTMSPLAVICNLAGNGIVSPGNRLELSATVTNRGDQSAVIDVFLDDLPPTLYQWCDSTQERLALGANQTGEVIFQFEISASALPGGYTFALVVDAPQHYPNSPPQRYEQMLQVLPSLQGAVQASDPTFFLQPATSAASPATLSPGEALTVQVTVLNRSDRVDRFRLRCLDLPSDWISISYPQGFQQPGLTLQEMYLDLNPGEQGTIQMLVMLPLDVLAGSYVGTVQLRSENQPHLALLDLLYLNVRPVYQLDLSFRTLLSRVRTQAGLFAIQASNRGNTARSLQLQVVALDDRKLCDYTLEYAELHLAPQQTRTSRLWAKPKHPWRRPLIGGGRLINFSVAVSDPAQHPLPETPMQGFIVWEARPWWQLLPFILLGVGALATLIWLIWWLLFRPPVVPRIVRFAPADTQYSVANGDVIRLGFQVSHPRRIQAIEIVGQSPEGEVISQPVSYDLSAGLPSALEPFCVENRQLLTCRNLLTDARRPGEYLFTLTVIPQPGRGSAAPDRLTAPPVAIAPFPLPEIIAFEPTQPVYPEAPPAQEVTGENGETGENIEEPYGIRLNWAISDPDQLQAVQIVGRDAEGTVVLPAVVLDFRAGVPEPLRPFCAVQEQLICQNVPTGIQQAGNYTFELTVVPATGIPDPPITQTTDPIRIEARPPQILSFQVNGAPVQPKYVLPIDQGQPIPQVLLSWEVAATPGTTVELLPVPGAVAPEGSLPLPLSPNPGATVFTLQVTNSAGQQVTRSFTIETFDPTPQPPAVVINGEEEAAAGNGGNGGSLSAPRPTQPGVLSPSELPPQFE